MATERKQQILEALAKMLENPKGEKITTATLAAKIGVSEAALYRHFANKAQMFEGLIEFIETSLLSMINKISAENTDGLTQARNIVQLLLKFAEKNPGMTRVLTGDALVNEDIALQLRINQLNDRIEASLRQSLKIAAATNAANITPEPDANFWLSFVHGRWQQFAKSGFKRKPTEYLAVQLDKLND